MAETKADEIAALRKINEARKVPMLRQIAAVQGIVGRSKMSKAELVDAILAKILGQIEPSETVDDVPAELCGHGIATRYPCSICREDERCDGCAQDQFGITHKDACPQAQLRNDWAEHAATLPAQGPSVQANQRYARTDGDIIRILRTFDDGSNSYVVESSPQDTYREGLRGTVSINQLREHHTLINSAYPADDTDNRLRENAEHRNAERNRQAGRARSAEVRLSELQGQLSFLAGYFRADHPSVYRALIEARDRSW